MKNLVSLDSSWVAPHQVLGWVGRPPLLIRTYSFQVFPDNTEHSNTDSYSWCILRLACVKRAQKVVEEFLSGAEVDFTGKELGSAAVKGEQVE